MFRECGLCKKIKNEIQNGFFFFEYFNSELTFDNYPLVAVFLFSNIGKYSSKMIFIKVN